jgi:transmembrane sensor
MKSSSDHENFKAAEEAAAWLLRLRQEDSPAVRAEFASWVRKGTLNFQEFLFAQAIWQEFDQVDPDTATRFTALVESDQNAVIDLRLARATDSVPITDRIGASAPQFSPHGSPADADPTITSDAATSKPRRSTWRIGVAAGIAALALGWLALIFLPQQAQTYTTAVGDQKAIKLSDGSVVHLNTATKVEVRYSRNHRIIELLSGEALFTVEKDPTRPFIVSTDSAQVVAVGTQFNVYRDRHADTRVTVLNGVVEVSETTTAHEGGGQVHGADAVRLMAGEIAQVDLQGRIAKHPMQNVQRAIAWRERRLVFPGDSIADIAEEFNRYNHVPIRVEGDTIRQRRMSGVFDADDPVPLLRFLTNDPEVEVVTGAREIIIRPRR